MKLSMGLLPLGLSVYSGLALAAGPDFSMQFAGAARVYNDDSHRAHITVPMQIANSADAFQGVVRVKAFLLPSTEYSELDDMNDGVVLTPMDFTVDLATNASTTVNFDAILPVMHRDQYLMGAYVNSNLLVAETNHANNLTTDLVDAGAIEVAGTRPAVTTTDYYSELGPVSVTNGAVSSSLRTIIRGTRPAHGGRNLTVRGFIANVAERKLYSTFYGGPGQIDKPGFGLAYSQQRNRAGEKIHVDIYGQGLVFNNLAPGRYKVITLMNSRDLVTEDDAANNLDVNPIVINAFNISDQSQLFFNCRTEDTTALTKNFVITKAFRGDSTWTVPTELPSWLAIGSRQGSLTDNQGSLQLPVTVSCQGLAEGNYQQTIAFTANTPTGPRTETMQVTLSVQGQNLPVLVMERPEASVDLEQTSSPVQVSFSILNYGPMALTWAATTDNRNVSMNTASGTLNSGATQRITLTVDPATLAPGQFRVPVTFRSNFPNGPQQFILNVRLR